MTDTSAPWEGELIGDATEAPYSALEWAKTWRLRNGIGDVFNPSYGVIKGTGGGTYEPLFVAAANPVSTNVEMQIGAALVNGRLYETDAAIALTVQANVSGNPRVDTVILRVDYTLQTITPVILQGSPAVSPVAPTLQQDAVIWEMALADIAVANGFATISQSDITQRQYYTSMDAVGWMPFAMPVVSDPGSNYPGSAAFVNGATFVIPFFLPSCLLLDHLRMVAASVTQLTMGFGVYVQDLNSGDSAQNSLRLVAQGEAVLATTAIPAFRTISADFPTVLTPGTYWLALQRRDAGGAFSLAASSVAADIFETLGASSAVTSVPNGQTLDFVTGFTPNALIFAVLLVGRVFGQTTPYI